jgi:hypothetical protein
MSNEELQRAGEHDLQYVLVHLRFEGLNPVDVAQDTVHGLRQVCLSLSIFRLYNCMPSWRWSMQTTQFEPANRLL